MTEPCYYFIDMLSIILYVYYVILFTLRVAQIYQMLRVENSQLSLLILIQNLIFDFNIEF